MPRLEGKVMIDEIKLKLAEMIAAILEADPNAIDEYTHFGEYGLESVTMTELADRINRELGLNINPAFLYEHNTIASLGEALSQLNGLAITKPEPTGADIQAGMIPAADRDFRVRNLEEELIRLAAGIIGIPGEEFPVDAHFGELGYESITLGELAEKISGAYGLEITPVLLYEKNTIRELARYLYSQIADFPAHEAIKKVNSNGRKGRHQDQAAKPESAVSPPEPEGEAGIAIIGMAGVFPQSEDLDEFWTHLFRGECLVGPVPQDREELTKWRNGLKAADPSAPEPQGGFMKAVDKFDPLFFNISPKEAELMDPQQRMFLETVWSALEEAGYSKSALAGSNTGVFVGISSNDYTDIQINQGTEINAFTATGKAYSILANRISYYFDFHGPSQAVDTACSSSLVALHYAVESLQRGQCDLAVTGGANILLSPAYYQAFTDAGMLSPAGRCKTFDKDADGYVRGEGVGALILKPLVKAIQDGDHVHGIIKASEINHGGRAHSLTAPNPEAQADLLLKTYRKAKIDPATVGYIEAHGTGTKLGDPIEIQALKKAFGILYQDWGYSTVNRKHCGIGSVKTNIGHLEAAAGIAGIIKVLLAMKHKQLPRTANFIELNPYIELEKTPFYIVAENQNWEPFRDPKDLEIPRRAGVSSFGFGGANSHIILEEYIEKEDKSGANRSDCPRIIVLSAKNKERLMEYITKMIAFLDGILHLDTGFGDEAIDDDSIEQEIDFSRERTQAVRFEDLAFTLQAGREAMEERLALVVCSLEELQDVLNRILKGSNPTCPYFRGNVPISKENPNRYFENEEGREHIRKLYIHRKLEILAKLWVEGVAVDWEHLDDNSRPRRISLPTYPFAREHYWISENASNCIRIIDANITGLKSIHPLLHQNNSNFLEQRYTTIFTGKEFFLHDHIVKGKQLLPGVVYLEMARAAFMKAEDLAEENAFVIIFKNVIWPRPLIVEEKAVPVHISLIPDEQDNIHFEVYSKIENTDNESAIHSQGTITLQSWSSEPPTLPLENLIRECNQYYLSSDQCYSAIKSIGLDLGGGLRSIEAIYQGMDKILTRLVFPNELLHTQSDFVIHPAIIDGALQAQIGLFLNTDREEAQKLVLPFSIEALQIYRKLPSQVWALIRHSKDIQPGEGLRKLDIDICDDQGVVCIQFKGLTFIKAENSLNLIHTSGEKTLLLKPVWRHESVANSEDSIIYNQHLVILCEMSNTDPQEIQLGIESRLKGVRCISLPRSSPKYIDQPIHKRFTDYGIEIFNEIRNTFLKRVPDNVIIQILVPGQTEKQLYTGFSGLLKTARQENSFFVGQMIEINDPESSDQSMVDFLVEIILENSQNPDHDWIKYQGKERLIRDWEEYDNATDVASMEGRNIPWKDEGVYLIIGGTGRLGLIFAREIALKVRYPRLILTGRNPLKNEVKKSFEELKSLGASITYKQIDITEREQVKHLIRSITEDNGSIDGILHCAGVIQDNYIHNKTETEFKKVLAPKVAGLVNLDEACRGLELDFLIVFSSIAASIGSPGQADYACANSFMDAYSSYRNSLALPEKSFKKIISINWPLWKQGGMRISEANQKLLLDNFGITPLDTEAGIRSFYRGFSSGLDKWMVLNGNLSKLKERLFLHRPKKTKLNNPVKSINDNQGNHPTLLNNVIKALIQSTSNLLKIKPESIDIDEELSSYGFNSIILTEFSNQLNHMYQLNLMPTVFFNHSTIKGFAEYLLKEYRNNFEIYFRTTLIQGVTDITEGQESILIQREGINKYPKPRYRKIDMINRVKEPSYPNNKFKEIAIIGMSGQFPMADNPEQFWDNLMEGKNCITEIPQWRWDWRLYYGDPAKEINKTNIKWGGFMNGVDEFDPLFFGISPKEAELMDPQQRLLMIHVWKCIEDAGYSARSLSGTKTGIFVGTYDSGYTKGLALSDIPIDGYTATGSIPSVGPNRMSYFLNLHGPSEPIETACSSSLVAINRALIAFENGTCEMAIVGGVNTILTPDFHISFSKAGMLSEDGLCKTFSNQANGYVRGEGAGILLLKPLEAAEMDGDHIYGVILGSAVNHGGHANSFTTPNSKAQKELLKDAYRKAGIDPQTVTYIEAHGTGTKLGDPIEIEGLKNAFAELFQDSGITPPGYAYCGLGSVKTNIGHLELSAGVAGVIKVLLQLKHKTLVKSLHCETINPYIQLDDSPFYIVRENREWPTLTDKYGKALPRRAGISSFGFGGVNAHVVIQEYIPMENRRVQREIVFPNPEVIVLSAKNEERLAEQVKQFLGVLEERKFSDIDLTDIAYTLQVGREAMETRLGIITASILELKEKLKGFLNSPENVPDLFRGQAKSNKETITLFGSDEELQEAVDKWIKRKKYGRILDLWVKGLTIDWNKMYEAEKPQRISLPTYPFSKERYWIYPSSAQFAVKTKSTDCPKDPLTSEPEAFQLLTFEERWEEKQLIKETLLPVKTVVCFLSDPVNQAKFISEINKYAKTINPQTTIIFIASGDTFRKESQYNYTVIPNDIKTYLQVFKTINREYGEVDGVLYLWAYEDPLYIEDYVAIITIFKALEQSGLKTKKLILSGPFNNQSERCYLESWIGFERSLKLLYSNTEIAVILQDSFSFNNNWVNNLIEELYYSNNRSVFYQNEKRYLCCIHETDFSKKIQPAGGLLRLKGTYLITGGCGRLGLRLAEHLAGTYQANLVLTGRSPLNEEKQTKLKALEESGSRIVYVQADICDLKSMKQVLKQGKEAFGKIHGVIHASGILEDETVFKKETDQFLRVIAPKVQGTLTLLKLFEKEAPDFICLFSSSSAILGDLGSCDYAIGNRFQMACARYGIKPDRQTKIVAVNWPYWKDGGMGMDNPQSLHFYLKSSGQALLETKDGHALFETLIAIDKSQHLVLYGQPARIRRFLGLEKKDIDHPNATLIPTPKKEIPETKDFNLEECVEWDLKECISELLKIDAEHFEKDANLADYGFDSISLSQFANQLTNHYNIEITPSIFFSYSTIEKLTGYFLIEHQQAISEFYSGKRTASQVLPEIAMVIEPSENQNDHRETGNTTDNFQTNEEPIAIIGMSGRFPGARNIGQLWEIIKENRSTVTEIPQDRFDWRRYYTDPASNSSQTDEDKIDSKWCGSIPGVGEFDPLFFEIPPQEAILMDPGQRLLLQESWNALEDAGYGTSQLKKSKIAMFVGVEQLDYSKLTGQRSSLTSQHPGILAARLAYFLNFSGPVMAINTACSSGLVALHQGILSLNNGECDTVIAAGVNLILSPEVYQGMTQVGMLSKDGQCFAFDKRANGIVPGEALAVLVLKKLLKAERDGDPIYAVIRGSGINYDGKTNGITAPNGVAQTDLLKSIYNRYRINPEEINYIVAHGTGTKLGDPVEINALNNTFKAYTNKQAYCALTSVKTNLGHTMAASGLVSLITLVQAMQHEMIPASLHCEVENDYIVWTGSPFFVNKKNKPWTTVKGKNKIGAVSAFGMSGTNAHVVVESYNPKKGWEPKRILLCYLLVFSAKTRYSLDEKIKEMIQFLEDDYQNSINIPEISHTLLEGRCHFEHRIALVVKDKVQAVHLLRQVSMNGSIPGVFHGEVPVGFKPVKAIERHLGQLSAQIQSVIENENNFREIIDTLAEFYCQGYEIDLTSLWEETPGKIHLPGYPFEKRHCWAGKTVAIESNGEKSTNETKTLSELITSPFKKNLVTIISNVLGLEEMETDIDKPLYQYGIDSILFVQIMQKINSSQAEQSVDLAKLQQCKTIREIIDLFPEQTDTMQFEAKNRDQVRTNNYGPRQELMFPELISLNSVHEGKPVFWFHAGIGSVEIYQKLAQRSKRPFYGIQARGWMTDEEPLQGIEEMAAYYTRIILKVQPEGTYDLGGYSMGGFFVYEVTRQLQLAGKTVNTIVMLDSVYIKVDGSEPENEDLVWKDAVLRIVNMMLLAQNRKETEHLSSRLIHRDEVNIDSEKDEFLARIIHLAKERGFNKTEFQLKNLIQQNAKVQTSYKGNDYMASPLPKPDGVKCYYFRNKSRAFYGELEPYFTLTPYDGFMDNYEYWKEWENQIRDFNIIDLDSSSHVMLLAELRAAGVVLSFCEKLYDIEKVDQGQTGVLGKSKTGSVKKISILAFGSRGDVHPFVALGKGLEKSGYEVTIAAIDEYQDLVTNNNLRFAPLNIKANKLQEAFMDKRRRENNAPLALSKDAKKYLEQNIIIWLEKSYEACRGCDLLLYTGLAFHHGIHVAQKLKVPSIPVYLQPITENSSTASFLMPDLKIGSWYNRLSYRMAEDLLWKSTGRPVNQWRSDNGLKPLSPKEIFSMKHHSLNPVIYGFSSLVFKKPIEWGKHVSMTGYFFLERNDDWHPAPKLASFLEAGSPPVYVGFGSMNDYITYNTTQKILKALKQTGERVILSVGWENIREEDLLQFGAENIFIAGYAPHHWLFPKMKAIIHQGGAGTTAAALQAGIPSIIIPVMIDQPFWANLAYELGTCPKPIPFRNLTSSRLRTALNRALNDSTILEKAGQIGRMLKNEDGVVNTVDTINRILSGIEYRES
jgi:acyl transferase domain-containing protein/UDP:flavonoid glycosyltransferase YjiC (YdhE family)/thioesterase domain-containing protein/acyl carrier protein